MLQKLKYIIDFVANMGWRYIAFRLKHEILVRSGLLKRKFPTRVTRVNLPTLQEWKQKKGFFFFANKEMLSIPRNPSNELKIRYENMLKGKFIFFNNLQYDLGKDYDWLTNPESGFKYDITKHWTEIPDLSKEAGDIKFVWEKSRFSYLYDVIRYDYHYQQDCSEFVFSEILSWIDKNPLNYGPNYKCSQEISLRVLNWIFALYYYLNSPILDETKFSKIIESIYWQIHHIRKNIHFSRIAVRNNHAITETLMLFLSGLIFPMIQDFKKWSAKGKKWLEEEIAYQVYDDGTFLQYSMNYHRVLIQLMTWGICLGELNNNKLSQIVYERAKKSLFFLRVCMNDKDGWLPNYGANDGALFFRLGDNHYRDYRGQLQALADVLKVDAEIKVEFEDSFWYGLKGKPKEEKLSLSQTTYQFKKGGYYIFRELEALTFIRCGQYKDRPSQADNLHIDIWYNGRNVIQDSGSYKYNTDEATLRYFMGTESHNTVMVANADQMKRAGRFIWYYWIKMATATIQEDDREIRFTGSIGAFKHVQKGITHMRTVVKKKNIPQWEIIDEVTHIKQGTEIKQLWHLPLTEKKNMEIFATDAKGVKLPQEVLKKYAASFYGTLEEQYQVEFKTTETPSIITRIKIIQ